MAKAKFNKKDDIIGEENILDEFVKDKDGEIIKGKFENTKNDEENNGDTKSDEEKFLDGVFSPSSLKEEEVYEEQLNKTEENKVKVKLNKDHKCCIGGERYYFKKDGVYTVNTNIKRILNKGGLLKPLS